MKPNTLVLTMDDSYRKCSKYTWFTLKCRIFTWYCCSALWYIPIVIKVFEFFSNYGPSALAFFGVSVIDCTRPFFEIRPETLFEFDFDFRPMGLYMDQNRNKLEKACFWSNNSKFSKNDLVHSIPETLKNANAEGA